MPERDLQLVTPIVYTSKYGLAVQRETVLLPGIYKGVGEDEKGVWYLGSRESMTNTVIDRGGAIGYPKEWIGLPTTSSGGLLVPRDPALPPLVFYIHGERPSSGPGLSQPAAKQEDNQVAVDVALNAQAANPALARSSAVTAGVGAGVSAGMVAAIIELEKADNGKYQIHEGQPPAETDLRKQFSIITR